MLREPCPAPWIYWKMKQVLTKVMKKKDDEYVATSDTELDAKLEVNVRTLNCFSCWKTCLPQDKRMLLYTKFYFKSI
uniref:Uncharacterized protein n=1 Tax=Apteryx owenii TaxID=8824 RepID=A0A8B9QI38_APTOW